MARIASISKPMTMCAVAKLCEEGKLDVDKPVSEYLGKDVWPEDKSSITLRQLLSHSSGIRHYERKHEIEARKQLEKEKGKDAVKAEEFENFAKHYKKATDALELFKDDELVHEPGSVAPQLWNNGKRVKNEISCSRQKVPLQYPRFHPGRCCDRVGDWRAVRSSHERKIQGAWLG